MRRLAVALVFAGILLLAANVQAGTTGTEFTDIYTTIQEWTQGYLGRVISLGAFLVGIAMGIVRQSIMAVVTGIGTALAVQYSPTVIESIVAALI
ncbi:MAG: TraA family conjugative transfer protein [Candidatus Bathyarchaeia archaeon]